MVKISIVTPSFNQGEFITQCLHSVKEQNYPHIEHIVMDGGSTDDTVDILRHYSSTPGWEHLRWVSERDAGQSDALNKGFRMATADLIGWLNSDDRYCPGCFETVAAAFHKNPVVDIFYGDTTWIDKTGRVWRIRREIEFNPFILLYHRVLYVPTTATFFRQRVFAEKNFLDCSLHFAMDYEFFLRLTRRGYQFKHVPEILADFRWHPASKSGSQARRQLQEHTQVTLRYSVLLQKLPQGFPSRLALAGLRTTAGLMRYSEKFFRGYYFDQFLSP